MREQKHSVAYRDNIIYIFISFYDAWGSRCARNGDSLQCLTPEIPAPSHILSMFRLLLHIRNRLIYAYITFVGHSHRSFCLQCRCPHRFRNVWFSAGSTR